MSAMRLACWSVCVLAFIACAQSAFGAGESKPFAGTDAGASLSSVKQYGERAAKLADGDVKGWLALADFCEAQLLFAKREAALRKVVAMDPDNADAHRRLDEVKVGEEWLPCAEAERRAAKEHAAKDEVFYGKAWVPSSAVDAKRAADRKQFGWQITTRVDGKYCVVFSAVSYEETQAVASVVDSTVAGYAALYAKVRHVNLSKPLVVQLFGNADALLAEFKRMSKTKTDIPKGFAGGYSPVAKMVILSTDIGVGGWNLDALLHTAAHESTHAIDDLGAGMDLNAMPTWIGEGRAIYAQYALVGRQFLPGALNVSGTDGRGELLEKTYTTAALDTLIAMDHKTFMPKAATNYATSWGFTHFLMHGAGGRYRDRFMKFLAGCPQHSSAADFQKIMGKVSDMDSPYQSYVEMVFLPAAKIWVNADRKAKGMAGEWK